MYKIVSEALITNINPSLGESYGGVYVPTLIDALIQELQKEVSPL